MCLRFAFFALLASLIVAPALADDDPAARPGGGALTIVETGRTPAGKPRYTIEAYSVDLNTLITEVLRRTGEEFTVSQDVTGSISLVLRNATAEAILDAVSRAAHPPIRISRGRGILVSLAPTDAGGSPGAGGAPRVAPGRGLLSVPIAGSTPDVASALQTPVSLDIPDGRPVPLAQAIKALEQQTGIAIRLDPRIPANLGFAARVTRTPLMVVLESIARTGALKWSAQPDGSVLVAPTDWMRLSLGGAALPSATTTPCPRCGRPIQPDWRYCPSCGQMIVHRVSPTRRSPTP